MRTASRRCSLPSLNDSRDRVDGGTATIVGSKIRYFPPEDYADNDDATLDVFAQATEIAYQVGDNVGGVGQAKAKAPAKKWGPSREYSRTNDDVNEKIYETARIKVSLVVNETTRKVTLKYAATATTDSRLKRQPNGFPEPAGANEGLPEFEYAGPNMFLQLAEENPQNPDTTPRLVPAGAGGVNLTFAAGGVGGSLSGEIDLGTWTNRAISGTAVIQERYWYEPGTGALRTGPVTIPNPGGWVYRNVRQKISWRIGVKPNGETTGANLDVEEVPYPGLLFAPAPLRLIGTSEMPGLVYKLGYPAKPGLARRANDPSTPNIDERSEPLTPPADWNTRIPMMDRTP